MTKQKDMTDAAIVWFRNDLRLHDNVTLTEAIRKSDKVYPVYCFDPRHFAETELEFPKTDSYRAQFLVESLQNLRDNLQAIGSDLIVRQGVPESVIPQLAKEVGASKVLASKEVTSEERSVEKQMGDRLSPLGIELELIWQSTLLHVDDIPWPINNVPDIFSQFRREAEKTTQVRNTVPAPDALNNVASITAGDIPTLDQLGLLPVEADKRAVLAFKGGETTGLARLDEYFWERDCLKNYKETRNGMLGADYSSKFSAWLANGSLSPRTIYEEVKRYEQQRVKNKSTYWLVFELLWRDYFRFIAKKYGNSIFQFGGIQDKSPDLRNDIGLFHKWKNGKTGVPFIDANMREINATGFMSNRGRQNVASFLVKDLKVNWTWGALFFESILIDYDVCSNWCNWNYMAGVGNDPRENRYFNIMSQAQRYDGQGEYVRHWIPELSDVRGKKIHYPTEIPQPELASMGVRLGEDYPRPLVAFSKWLY
ncbi:DASH family cryptochrome [Tunicatimonas pelagia]|uniref:DASH family cryptochrome n=1 Tax=Tunicatimonas pelagia TaxID=931531 RepID=UPI0026659CF2|nr:DASH family cryptochrome [Tunicatimonas pelagia]WKN40990.1 DASH family cryptochrome [Tunicatimonas pelagia]